MARLQHMGECRYAIRVLAQADVEPLRQAPCVARGNRSSRALACEGDYKTSHHLSRWPSFPCGVLQLMCAFPALIENAASFLILFSASDVALEASATSTGRQAAAPLSRRLASSFRPSDVALPGQSCRPDEPEYSRRSGRGDIANSAASAMPVPDGRHRHRSLSVSAATIGECNGGRRQAIRRLRRAAGVAYHSIANKPSAP